MAIDQVSESVQRQDRPVLNLKSFQNLSIKEQDLLMETEFNKSLLLRGPVNKSYETHSHHHQHQHHNQYNPNSLPSLWPPLKSPRYIKKQLKKRNYKPRVISSASIMIMNESSINHQRVSEAINDLSANSITLFDDKTINSGLQGENQPFWSKAVCREFWNEYLECEIETTRQLSHLTINDTTDSNGVLTCPMACYTKITKSIRKLLKRTFRGASTFSELETFVINLINSSQNLDNFISFGQIIKQSTDNIVIKLDTPFHRVWLHAICQYYGIQSYSRTVNDQRLVHINFAKRFNFSSPKIDLYNFLLEF